MSFKNKPFVKTRPGDVARPYLPITIINPENDKKINVFALIDTGADECALPASFARVLDHNLQEGKQKQINTGNGLTTAYRHTVQIRAEDYFSENVLIDFMPNLYVPLLGVKNFLSEFILNIDYPNKIFSLL